MKKKENNIVEFALDPHNPPPLSDEQRAELEALARIPDEAIDYSDIPPLPDELSKERLKKAKVRRQSEPKRPPQA